MTFSIFSFFIIATIALILYSVALEIGRRHHRELLEEKLRKQRQLVESTHQCPCLEFFHDRAYAGWNPFEFRIFFHNRVHIFEKDACLIEKAIARGDLAGAEELLEGYIDSTNVAIAAHNTDLAVELVRHAREIIVNNPQSVHLTIDLGAIDPSVADLVQAKLYAMGYRTLLNLDPRGRYQLVQLMPGCVPALRITP